MKVNSLEVNDTVEEDIKLKEKLDEGVKEDGSEGGPSKNNFNSNVTLVDNFNTLHTAAENNLDAESRFTVVYRKYFHAQYLLNFPST